MTRKKRPHTYASYRRKRMRLYCPGFDTDSDASKEDEEAASSSETNGRNVAAVGADRAGGAGPSTCGLLSDCFNPLPDLDEDIDSGDASDENESYCEPSASGGSLGQPDSDESGGMTDEAAEDIEQVGDNDVASAPDAEPNDYLAGRTLVSGGRSYVGVIQNMADFEREMVRMQTENEMSKTACQRVFALLQKNSAVLSQHLPHWTGSFRSARRRVLALVPAVDIVVVGANEDGPVQLGPYSAYPKKLVEEQNLTVRYTLYTSKLKDVIALHAHLHGHHEDHEQVLKFDLGLDGVPESLSGGVSIDVLTIRFVGCRSVYSLAVLRPRRTGLHICDSVILKQALQEYKALREGREKAVNKVLLRFVICDAPKRAKVLAQKSHSGYSSCQYCHIKGTYVDGAVCFPPEHENELSEARTKESFEACADEAERDGLTDCHGVKGSSLLRGIPEFDYVSHVVQERMHLADLGACRQLCRHMFGGKIGAPTKRSSDQVYRPVSAAAFDEGARLVRVPSEFSRRTRELSYGNWKAEEYRFVRVNL